MIIYSGATEVRRRLRKAVKQSPVIIETTNTKGQGPRKQAFSHGLPRPMDFIATPLPGFGNRAALRCDIGLSIDQGREEKLPTTAIAHTMTTLGTIHSSLSPGPRLSATTKTNRSAA